MALDFTAQEPETPLGRGNRQRRVTPAMAEWQARLTEIRNRRTTNSSTGNRGTVGALRSGGMQEGLSVPAPSTPAQQGVVVPPGLLEYLSSPENMQEFARLVLSKNQGSPAGPSLDNTETLAASEFLDSAERLELELDPQANDPAMGAANGNEVDDELNLDELLPDFPDISSRPVTLPVRTTSTTAITQTPGRSTNGLAEPLSSKQLPRSTMMGTPSPPLSQSSGRFNQQRTVPSQDGLAADTEKENVVPNDASGAGRKRSADEISDGDENGKGKASRSIAQLSPNRRIIVNESYTWFRKAILQFDCFPSSDSMEMMRSNAWFGAMFHLQNKTGNDFGIAAPNDTELDLIQQRLSQLRGTIKTAARDCVVVRTVEEIHAGLGFSYGGFYFTKPVLPTNRQPTPVELEQYQKTINDNTALYNTLRKDYAFLYQNPFQIATKGTLFRNYTMFTVINKVFFDDGKRSEGLRGGFFEEEAIPLPAIALVAAAYECALDEWKTGVFVSLNFTATAYEAVYRGHLKTLQDWTVYSQNQSKACLKMQKDLYEGGRTYAGVLNAPDGDGDLYQQAPSLSTAAFAADE
ncbi:hypothetical protein V5O48_000123 [Marasmius crinis-equi]|uniref:DUF6532 domain-containing protein n=1 Tax=Marasmius crinis-equi TaxID=585013 RepID=A0ABR3G2G7_9AGAR